MKITALVENISLENNIKSTHGLSLYIETKKHKVLFDLGPDKTLFENAKQKNIDLTKVDTVIISHGHYDHGGALENFLKINSTAKIFIQKKAFEPHYKKQLFKRTFIGINNKLATNNQIILLDGDFKIDDELSLFTVQSRKKCYSYMNKVLLDSFGKDKFLHEQNLLISETKECLVVGCGHVGIVNILEKVANKNIDLCIGGFHLSNPKTKKTVRKSLLNKISLHLSQYKSTQFYTCHCTGIDVFKYLETRTTNIKYLYCGNKIEI